MSARGPICGTTAQPGDSGTLVRGRTLSPSDRHGYKSHGHGRREALGLGFRLRKVQKATERLHEEYRKAFARAGSKSRGRRKNKPAAATSPPPPAFTLPPPLPPIVPHGLTPEQEAQWEKDEDRMREKNEEFWEKEQDISFTVVPALWDLMKDEGIPWAKRLLESRVAEIEQICNDIVRGMEQLYELAENMHMSPLTNVVGRSKTSLAVLGLRMMRRCEALIEFLESIKGFFEYGGPLLVLIDLVNTFRELCAALKDHDLHDGGRTVAYHITKILILSFVSITAIIGLIFAAVGLTFELATFGSLVGICALPLVFLKPPKGYTGPASDAALKDARDHGHAYSKEYMEAVHKYLHDPSPINLENLNALR
jgi:hypothetical protein